MADKNETNVCIYCRVGNREQLTYEKTKPAIIAKDCKVKSSGKANAQEKHNLSNGCGIVKKSAMKFCHP